MEVKDEAGDLVMLTDHAQLRKLATLLRNNEEPLMSTVIKSQNERVKYLKSVNDAYDNAMSLLDESSDLNNKYQLEGNPDKASIAHDILHYITYGMNMSMQIIRNCSLRVSCISKLKIHYDSLVKNLAELDTKNLTNVRRLATDVTKYKECMWEYSSKCRSGSARAISKAYSMVLKQEGIKFPDLVERHKNELGYKVEFETLEEAEKLEVYNSIIRESGRAEIPKLELASTAFGVAVLVATAGIMVWDIFTAEHKLEAILRNSLSTISEIGAFAVQLAVEGAVTTALVEMELGVFVVALAGFVAGSVAGLLFVAASGALIDLIFQSGGKVAPDLSGLKFHTVTMPDGMAFANQLARRSSS